MARRAAVGSISVGIVCLEGFAGCDKVREVL